MGDFALLQMSKHTNLDINDAAGLRIVHILQQPTSRPTTRSMQSTIVNTLKKKFLPLPVGKYSKLTMRSTQWHHHVNQGKSGLEAERVRPLGALRSLQSEKKLAAKKRQLMHFLSTAEKEKLIQDYILRQTAGAKNWVGDTEGAFQQE